MLNECQGYDRELAKVLGLETAIFLSEAINQFQFANQEGSLIEGEWFYLTFESVYEKTFLSRRKQEVAIKNLVEKNLIEFKLKGLPPRRCFRFKMNEMDKIIKI